MARDPMFPLAPASVADGSITVDLMLKEPTRLQNYVSQLVERDLLATQFYGNVTTSGGTLLYDQLTENSALALNGPGVVAPGSEFPVIHTADGEPMVATVKKTGGKFGVTDEAIARNDAMVLQRKAAQVANTMRKDLDERAIAAFKEAHAKVSGTLEITSGGWAAATGVKAAEKTAKTGEGQIVTDLLTAIQMVESKNLGYKLNALLLHPKDALNMKLALGLDGHQALLTSLGLTMYVSTAVTEGEGIALQTGAVGVMGVESPISTETWREAAVQTTWTQTWATVAFAVTDPYAMVTLKSLGS